MLRRLTLCLALLCPAPIFAQDVNLSARAEGAPGSAAQLVLAQRAYLHALEAGDAVLLLSAIRLARGVTSRPATSWKRVAADEDTENPVDLSNLPDPGGEAAIAIARNLAGEDPDLQDLVYDLDAQLPGTSTVTAVEVRSELEPGASESWTVPLFGEVAAELGLVGPDGVPLALDIMDETGASVCNRPPSGATALCRFTPARNGFFTVTVRNEGSVAAVYRLIGN